MRASTAAILLLLVLTGCATPAVSSLGGQGGEDPGEGRLPVPGVDALTIVHVNVGQGDATLIKGPERSLLVDGGGNGMGSTRVLAALRSHDVDVLDWAVATHPHSDHVGGLDEVFDRIEVLGGVWDNGDSHTTQSFSEYEAAAWDTTGGRHTIEVGTVFDLGGGATATCVAVNGAIADGSQVADVDSLNDRSVALLVEWGHFRYVLAGDLGGVSSTYVTDVETALAPLIGDVDVMRVSHHGSRFSTNSTWLNTLRPEAAIISLGDGNTYGHPAAEVLDRLTGADSAVTVPGADIYLTERGSAPGSYVGEGDVVVYALPTRYRILDQHYDATAF